MFTVIGEFGIACIVLAPVLLIGSWLVLGQLGKTLSAIEPSKWEGMRPGLFPSLSQVRDHNQRFRDFVEQREYLALKNPKISRLVILYRISVFATWATIACAVVSIVLVVKGP